MSDGGVTKGGGSDGDAESRRGQKLADGNFRGELLGQAGWEINNKDEIAAKWFGILLTTHRWLVVIGIP